MLRNDYRWIELDGRAFLHFRYCCVATVKPGRESFETSINWRDQVLTGRAASLEQGRRFVEQWVLEPAGLARRNAPLKFSTVTATLCDCPGISQDA